MILTDAQRLIVDVNPALVSLLGRKRDALTSGPLYGIVDSGPLASDEDWAAALAEGRFSGVADMLHEDGRPVGVQWAGNTEVVTGRRLVLFVALSVSRWGARFRRNSPPDEPPHPLTPRQLEIVHLVALGASGPEIGDELSISHETVGRTYATPWTTSARAHGHTSSPRPSVTGSRSTEPQDDAIAVSKPAPGDTTMITCPFASSSSMTNRRSASSPDRCSTSAATRWSARGVLRLRGRRRP